MQKLKYDSKLQKIQSQYYFQMKILFIALILVHAFSQTVLVASDPTTTTITFPANRRVGLVNYHNTNNPNFTGVSAARWIYIAGRDSWPNNYRVVFQSLFLVDCPQVNATLRITADDNFTAYLNGALVGSGNNWTRLYTFNIRLVCGSNNLTVVTYNLGANSPAALIFAVVQNQANCYNCRANPLAYYNRRSCRCQCSGNCTCINTRLQRYFGYPYCGCLCNFIRPCNIWQYWDRVNCVCNCIPRLCAPRYVQNSRSCLCVCRPISCPTGQRQDPLTCECRIP